ncbi:hypothetical protein [Dietzia sp. ANT_WB102]|nr:hypothetical protein [Dietzia sp. ANT_WB102]
MPDFKAISDAITAVKNILDGVVGMTGSLAGEGLDAVLGSLGQAAPVGDA